MFIRDILTHITSSAVKAGADLSVRDLNESIREAHRRALGGYVETGRKVEVIRFMANGLVDRVAVTA
jgi:hypothetical protein